MSAMSNGSSGLGGRNSTNIIPDVCQSQDDTRHYHVNDTHTTNDDSDDELLGTNQSLIDNVTPPTHQTAESHEDRFGEVSSSDHDHGIRGNDSAESQSVSAMKSKREELDNIAELSEEIKLEIDFREGTLGGAESASAVSEAPDRSRRNMDVPERANESREMNDSSFTLSEVDSHSQRPYHCHTGPPATTDMLARNQMITVVILCITFMIGESVGKKYLFTFNFKGWSINYKGEGEYGKFI